MIRFLVISFLFTYILRCLLIVNKMIKHNSKYSKQNRFVFKFKIFAEAYYSAYQQRRKDADSVCAPDFHQRRISQAEHELARCILYLILWITDSNQFKIISIHVDVQAVNKRSAVQRPTVDHRIVRIRIPRLCGGKQIRCSVENHVLVIACII